MYERAVFQFGTELQRGGVGVFYYAGHGLQMFGRNYLVPVDAEIRSYQDVDVETIDVDRVMAQMENANNGANIVILDACRNNPFASVTKEIQLGLAAPKAPKGTLVAYATSPDKVAEDGSGSNSPFAKALAHTLRQPGLEATQVFKQVGLTVNRETQGRQTPWFTSSAAEDVYFVVGSAPPSRPIEPPGDDLLAERGAGAPIVGYVVAGVGVAALAVGGYFGAQAFDRQGRLEDRGCRDGVCVDPDARGLQDDRDRFANLANIGVGVGVVGVLVGGYLVFTHESGIEPSWQTAKGPAATKVSIMSSRDGSGGQLLLGGTF